MNVVGSVSLRDVFPVLAIIAFAASLVAAASGRRRRQKVRIAYGGQTSRAYPWLEWPGPLNYWKQKDMT